MKICVISTTIWPIPLKAYGGLEQIAYWCAEGLAKPGNEVLLVAPLGSVPPPGVELHGTTQRESEQQAFSGYRDRLKNYDVIVDHSWEKWSYTAQMDGSLKSPIVGVCHAPIETMYVKPPPLEKPCLVGISKDHTRRIQRHLGVQCRTVYNGVDLDFYRRMPKEKKRNGRYLFMGRMSTIKGPHVAVEIAQKMKVSLDVVGDDKFSNEPQYTKRVKDGCTGEIKYWGGVSREKTVELYSTRKALLNTILWDAEPFGLVMVEAMACGMPVVTFDRGSPREIVVNKETGFLVDGQEEMEALVKSDAVASISPERCRERAAEFSKEKMGLRYQEVCQEAADGGW